MEDETFDEINAKYFEAAKKEKLIREEPGYGHVMVDIETLGLAAGSVIATIGAQPFNILTGKYDVERAWYRRIDLESCTKIGMTIDVKTLQWWLSPDSDQKSKDEVFGTGERTPLYQALWDFSRWFRECKYTYIWAKGPDFDCVLLEWAIEKLNSFQENKDRIIPLPWLYKNKRDVRTIVHLAQLKSPHAMVASQKPVMHHALSDCHVQIEEVVSAFRVLTDYSNEERHLEKKVKTL